MLWQVKQSLTIINYDVVVDSGALPLHVPEDDTPESDAPAATHPSSSTISAIALSTCHTLQDQLASLTSRIMTVVFLLMLWS